jgi:hypothetical protein
LAELVFALNRWLMHGGFPPDVWPLKVDHRRGKAIGNRRGR